MKSIETLSNGLDGIGRGLYNLNFFLWYFGILCTCERNALHLPSFRANRKFSPNTLLLFSHHVAMGVSCNSYITFVHNFSSGT
jgi:hypothetical protein